MVIMVQCGCIKHLSCKQQKQQELHNPSDVQPKAGQIQDLPVSQFQLLGLPLAVQH